MTRTVFCADPKDTLLVVALLLALLVSFAVAAPYGLTKADLETVKQLANLAVQNSTAVTVAKREYETQRSAESFGTKVLDSVNLTVSGSSGNLTQLPDGQVNPSFGVSVSVNVTNLVKTEPSKLPELEARVRDATERVRQDVLTAFVAWWSAGHAGRAAAESVDFSVASYRAVEARVKAGTATATDLISAKERVTASENRLRDANAAIVTLRADLARICGISAERLERTLAGLQ